MGCCDTTGRVRIDDNGPLPDMARRRRCMTLLYDCWENPMMRSPQSATAAQANSGTPETSIAQKTTAAQTLLMRSCQANKKQRSFCSLVQCSSRPPLIGLCRKSWKSCASARNLGAPKGGVSTVSASRFCVYFHYNNQHTIKGSNRIL